MCECTIRRTLRGVSIARAVVRLIGEIAAPQMRDADEHADAITAAILRSDRTSPEPHDDRFTAYRDVEVGKTRTRLLASSLRATGPIPKSRTSSVRFWINERQKSRLPSVGRYALLLSARSRATTLAWPPRA